MWQQWSAEDAGDGGGGGDGREADDNHVHVRLRARRAGDARREGMGEAVDLTKSAVRGALAVW